jgi:hypothetical protein
MRPTMIIDAWAEPAGDVLVVRSRLFPRHVAVLLSARRSDGRVARRTCVQLGDDVEIADRGVLAARIRQLIHQRRRRHAPAG